MDSYVKLTSTWTYDADCQSEDHQEALWLWCIVQEMSLVQSSQKVAQGLLVGSLVDGRMLSVRGGAWRKGRHLAG